jgi:voltage-dependent potassium channel beta subunit
MQYRNLGKSGLKVSEISLGSWLTYGGYVEKQQAVDTIHAAYEAGVNFYDTANAYMRGEAEKVVGEALKGYARNSVILATKVWGQMGEGPNDRGLSRKHILDQCDASLKRLGMDYIDLYYCHSFDPSTPMQETLRAMDDLVRQGKVLYVGVSNWSAAQMTEAVHLADRSLLDRIVASQPPYSMLKRDIEQDILPTCDKLGIGQVVYSPLAQGVLSGKYKSMTDVPKGSRRDTERGSQIISRYITESNLERVQRLQEIAAEAEISMTQLALAWVLRQPGVSSAIIGASSPQQLEENVKASGVQLSQTHLEQIEAILK